MKLLALQCLSFIIAGTVFGGILAIAIMANPPDWNQFDPAHPAAAQQAKPSIYTLPQEELNDIRQQAFDAGYGLETQVTQHCFIKSVGVYGSAYACFGNTPYAEQFVVCVKSDLNNGDDIASARNLCG